MGPGLPFTADEVWPLVPGHAGKTPFTGALPAAEAADEAVLVALGDAARRARDRDERRSKRRGPRSGSPRASRPAHDRGARGHGRRPARARDQGHDLPRQPGQPVHRQPGRAAEARRSVGGRGRARVRGQVRALLDVLRARRPAAARTPASASAAPRCWPRRGPEHAATIRLRADHRLGGGARPDHEGPGRPADGAAREPDADRRHREPHLRAATAAPRSASFRTPTCPYQSELFSRSACWRWPRSGVYALRLPTQRPVARGAGAGHGRRRRQPDRPGAARLRDRLRRRATGATTGPPSTSPTRHQHRRGLLLLDILRRPRRRHPSARPPRAARSSSCIPRLFTLPAFDLFGKSFDPLTLHTYGVLLAIAFLAGLWIVGRREASAAASTPRDHRHGGLRPDRRAHRRPPAAAGRRLALLLDNLARPPHAAAERRRLLRRPARGAPRRLVVRPPARAARLARRRRARAGGRARPGDRPPGLLRRGLLLRQPMRAAVGGDLPGPLRRARGRHADRHAAAPDAALRVAAPPSSSSGPPAGARAAQEASTAR